MGYIFVLLLAAYQLLHRLEQTLYVPTHLEWHLFLLQLDHATLACTHKPNSTQFHSKAGDELQLKYAANQKAGNVVYLSKNGGYHPLLIGMTTGAVFPKRRGVYIEATWDKEVYQIEYYHANRTIHKRYHKVVDESHE